MIPKQLETYSSALGVPHIIVGAQASIWIETGRILRNVASLHGQGN